MKILFVISSTQSRSTFSYTIAPKNYMLPVSNKSKKASTNSGSNCVPLLSLISAMHKPSDNPFLYGLFDLIGVKTVCNCNYSRTYGYIRSFQSVRISTSIILLMMMFDYRCYSIAGCKLFYNIQPQYCCAFLLHLTRPK